MTVKQSAENAIFSYPKDTENNPSMQGTADLFKNVRHTRSTVALLLADTSMSYSTGAADFVAEGDVVQGGRFLFEVAASNATDNPATTDGTVKLYPLAPFSFDMVTVPTDSESVRRAAMQSLMDYVSGLGFGVINGHDEAEYAIDLPILHRSGVHVDMGGALISNDTTGADDNDECCWLFGNIRSTTFTGNPFSWAAHTFAASQSGLEATFATPGDGANYSVGDIVFIYSDEGITGSLTWRYFQQMARVTAITADTVTIDAPLYKSTVGYTINITKPDGVSLGVGTAGNVAYVCSDFSFKNAAVRSANYRWTHGGGAYNGCLSDIDVKSSDSMLSLNGFSRCSVTRLHGNFQNQVINTAYFSHNNSVSDVIALWDGRTGGSGNAALLFEEGSHDNARRNIWVDAGDSPGCEQAARFAGGTSDNMVDGLTFKDTKAGSYTSIFFTFLSASSSAAAPMGGNRVRNFVIDRTNCTGIAIYENSDFPSTEKAANIISGGEFILPLQSSNLVTAGGSNLVVEGVRCSKGDITIDASTVGVHVSDVTFTDQRTFTVSDNSAAARVANVNGVSAALLGQARHLDANYASSSSTTSGNVIATATVPVEGIDANDAFTAAITGQVGGLTDAQHVEIYLVGVDSGSSPLSVKVADMEFPSAAQGAFNIQGLITCRTTSLQRSLFTLDYNGTRSTVNTQSNLYTDLGSFSIEFRAWVTNAADNILVYGTEVMPVRKYSTF